MRRRPIRLRLYLFLAALFVALDAVSAPVDDLKVLLGRGDARAAYERGRGFPDQLGEPAFDFYFGIAAIDAGHAAEGTLALERYVITYPNDRNARLELARGYFVQGEDARAREEFEGVLASDPPPAVRTTVKRYLEVLRVREARRRITLAFFAETGIGYDSNVNGGVSSPTVSLPIGTVLVQPAGQKSDNGFLMAAGGLQVTVPVTPAWGLFAAVGGDTKNHFRQDPFDLRSVALSVGGAYEGRRDLVRVTALAGSLLLDDNRFRDIHSLGGDWFRLLDPATTLQFSLQYAQLGYTGSNAPRDSDLYSGAAGVRRALDRPWSPMLSFAVNAGRERNRRNRDDLARDFYGLRAGLGLTPREPLTAYVTFTAQRSEHLDADSLVGSTRRDWFVALEAGLSRALTNEWSVRAELTAMVNRSGIELYDYARQIAQIKVRYETR